MMNSTKNLTCGLLLLTTLLFLSCSPSNSGQQDTNNAETGDCIEKVISQDDKLGTIRNHACEQISLAETIQNYTDAMGKLDSKDCPEAFKVAYGKHREAWVKMIPLVEKYPDLRGEMHDLFDELEKSEDAEEYKLLLKNVWDTWGEVEEAMKAK